MDQDYLKSRIVLLYTTQDLQTAPFSFKIDLVCGVTNTEVFLMCIYTKCPKHESVISLCCRNLGSKTQKKL